MKYLLCVLVGMWIGGMLMKHHYKGYVQMADRQETFQFQNDPVDSVDSTTTTPDLQKRTIIPEPSK